jgi:hypothetical protein
MLRTRTPYTGCNAGITHFHADPHGRAPICKVGRDPRVDLIADGAPGLCRLAAAADALLTRHGGCSGCTLQKTCGTCMPLASLHRQAQATLEVFCQHGGRWAAISLLVPAEGKGIVPPTCTKRPELMAAVAVELLTRPPEPAAAPKAGALPPLASDAVEDLFAAANARLWAEVA